MLDVKHRVKLRFIQMLDVKQATQKDTVTQTWNQIESADRAQRERSAEALAERMASFDAGLCSLASVHAGGTVYERDMAETALELNEAGIAEPIAMALAGWLASQTVARAPGRAA